ncbi:MAG: hypothetical protein IH941_11200 [Acidobacteria bacterium]|nr:hypothetical protein [Acidobacteriota bacterium]
MIKRSAANRAYGLIDPDAEQAPTRRRRRVNRSARTLLLPAAALIFGGLLLSGTLSAFSSLTDNAGNLAAAPALNPPTDPTAPCGTSITLDWTATPDTYATGHRVFRATSPGGPYSQIAEVTPRTTTSTARLPACTTTRYGPTSRAGRASTAT